MVVQGQPKLVHIVHSSCECLVNSHGKHYVSVRTRVAFVVVVDDVAVVGNGGVISWMTLSIIKK